MQIDRILGNVGVLYVGAYNSSTQYEYLNCVTYNGSSYVCVNQDGVTGVTPGTTNDWQLSAQKGDTGGQGAQGEQGIQGATGNGIQSIEKTSSSGLTDTYTISFTDGSSTTFEVENGKGIVSIEKTSSDGNVDTYTITYNDDTTSTFTVTNGEVTNEELQQALAQERVISDGKYARALKTPVTDVESTQIYAENDVVDDLVINGVELTQVVTENSPSLDNPSEVQVPNEQNIQIAKNNLFNLSSVTVTNHITIENNLLTTEALNTYGNFSISNSIKLFKGDVYLSFDIRLVSGTLDVINKAILNEFQETSLEMSRFGSTQVNNNWTRIKFKATLDKIYDLKRIWVQVGNATSAILEVKDVMISYYDVEYEDYYDITNITIPLTNSAIGQYADTIDRENSVQNKFIQELTLTGSESDWGREDTSVGTRFFKPLQNSIISNANKAPYALCTHFKLANDGGTYNTIGNLFAIYTINTAERIAFGSFTDISTVDEWKAKLKELYEAGTPVKVYYVAKTSKQEPLSEEVQTALSNFKLYKDLNNVAIDSGSMSFIYNKSLIYTINQLTQLVQTLSSEVQALQTPTTEPTVETTSEVQADG